MLRPLNTNVILKKEKVQTTTASGIVLVAPKETIGNQARVIAVGPKCDETLNVDSMVIFKEYAGTNFKQDDEEYIILDEKDILAVIE